MGKRNGKAIPFGRVNGSGLFILKRTLRDGAKRIYKKEQNGCVSLFTFWGKDETFCSVLSASAKMLQVESCIEVKKRKFKKLLKKAQVLHDYRKT